jgi:hypothetical protein
MSDKKNPFPNITLADRSAYAAASFSAVFRYVGDRDPRQPENNYLVRCMGLDGAKIEFTHTDADFEVTDPRVAKCLELHLDYFTGELDYLRVS